MAARVKTDGELKDGIVSRVCAIDTWAGLKAAMDGGYVPTCRGRTKPEREFISLLRREGYRVWGNKGRMW